MGEEQFGLDAVGQILVPVSDVERSTAFYRDVLGMRFLFAYPGLAFFDCGGVRIYLARPDEPGFAGVATVYYRVANIHEAARILAERGADKRAEPHVVCRDDQELWMAFFRDPDGNNVALMAEVPI